MLTIFENVKFTLCSEKEDFIKEFHRAFDIIDNEVFILHQAKSLKTNENQFNVLLHLADNSFGFLPEQLIQLLGEETQTKLQQQIIDNYYSELIVGDCVLLPLEGKPFQFLLYSPISRAKESISGSDCIFQAFRTSIVAIDKFNANQLKKGEENFLIKSILLPELPGLGSRKKDLGSVLFVRQLWEIYKVFIGTPKKKNKYGEIKVLTKQRLERQKQKQKQEQEQEQEQEQDEKQKQEQDEKLQPKKQNDKKPRKIPFPWNLGNATFQDYHMTNDLQTTETKESDWYY
ncbi:tpr domain protein in aerotolerance operon batb [Anaeramoeba flamelloides]|uniref:Tpr domain protein in aerotolerance operon batb n=1 Tax=Anaeramoeba flamelloides TaxID=1746091 RepID=A0AAV7ZC96_9EUKA|nr:tpr domain protein in aerotolerance operon batb [Anaeramoeba flamelloides]